MDWEDGEIYIKNNQLITERELRKECEKRIEELEAALSVETYRYVELAAVNDDLEKRIAELEAALALESV